MQGMQEEYFRFKQFSVIQDHVSMKVGTDAVLLGAWTEADSPQSILDIGTGTGIIALMMAQKFSATVHAIDIDAASSALAVRNFDAGPWRERMFAHHTSLQDFAKSTSLRFDLIVSNPPYFGHHKEVSPTARYIARHADLLADHDLADGISRLLLPGGSCCLILPPQHARVFLKCARPFGLFPQRITHVRTLPEKPVKRWLMKLSNVLTENHKEDELLIKTNKKPEFSQEFITLTKPFYLNF
ncbi:MAG: tRNA1(Val) (adenine(37)-N6)-methyltransferase [Bacteroidota bacterium]|jgi:tRNA1Val (adenine37-N6)-methyltransferase